MLMLAQEEPMELHVPFATPSLASEHTNSQIPRIDTLSHDRAPENDLLSDQQWTLETSESKASDDDEVQFVFSAPRRRKRKRKRFEFSYSPSMLKQCSVPPIGLAPKRTSTTQWDPLRRRSLGVLEQLESCHIGMRGSKESVVRRNSLPVAPSAIAPRPKAQASWLQNSSYSCVQNTRPTAQPSLKPWWNSSRTFEETNSVKFPDLRPPNEDPASKKRRLDRDLPVPESKRLSQSSQVSPRTTPISTLPSCGSSTRDSVMDSSDMLWTPEMLPLPRATFSNRPMINSWSEFDCSDFNQFDMKSCQPKSMHRPIPMDVTLPHLPIPPTNYLHQPRIEQFQSSGIWQQDFSQAPVAPRPQVQYRPPFEAVSQFPMPFHTSFPQARPQTPAVQWRTPPKTTKNCAPQRQTVLSPSCNTVSRPPPSPVSLTQGLHAQNRQILTSPCPPQVTFQPPQPAPSDLLRKPSLYKIPAWPTSEITPAQPLATTLQFQSQFSSSDKASNMTYQSGSNLSTVRHDQNSIHQVERPSRNLKDNFSSVIMNESSSTSHVTPARIEGFQAPRARIGRKHSPNLIVDIAETCQDLFPFAEVAERHSVPTKRVFDTFSAIIQLPLLRNADDRRRHGSLGKQRMRGYRDARKAMEKAQEAERKADTRAMRVRVEEAGRGKGQANASPLLKTAILNNANYSTTDR